MRKLTASNLVHYINQLDRHITFNYVNPTTKGVIKIERITLPEGPIRIKRWDPSKGEVEGKKKTESISSELIWRVANAFLPDTPINLERVLGASYNTRSVFEALLAHTPEFYFCYPGRIETTGGHPTIKKGHKHLIWKPNDPHKSGVLVETKTDLAISEIPITNAVYDSLVLPETLKIQPLDIEIKRRHAQIQIALYFIGRQLQYRTWVAKNDWGILYKNKKLAEFEGIISSLKNEKIMLAYDDAIKAALFIDIIWFKNSRLMPAVMEIEHSTGITSGLSRMKNFYDIIPPSETKYVIVAPDEDRDKVIREANKSQFRDLKIRFFPYSAVEELYSLCNRRKLRGVTEEFLDCFMEPLLQ